MRPRPGPAIAVLLMFLIVVLAVPVPSTQAALPPSCGSVITVSTTLSADIGPCLSVPPNGAAVTIGASNIVLDCAGHTITGPNTVSYAAGISINGFSDVTIENCVVTGFWTGIVLFSSSGDTLLGNTANGNGYTGIQLTYEYFGVGSDSNTLNGNTANGNGFVNGAGTGIGLFVSSNNILEGNTANGNDGVGVGVGGYNVCRNGVSLCSVGNTIQGNTANNNDNNNQGYGVGYEDDSTNLGPGSGTVGTWNTWQNNVCTGEILGSLPTGLCSSSIYNFGGFLPPLANNGNYKDGRTLPVKFQLTDSGGNFVSTAVAQIWVDGGRGTSSGSSNVGNYFRYDTVSNQYVFNLATTGLGIGPHSLAVTLDDGSSYSIAINLT